ncbi:MAG TPA: adenylate/guanylate cyclase domain-containing protein, partial [Variovorax sp.]
MLCPNCSHPNSQAARFCEACGTALRRQCRQCGHALSAEAKFCSECGCAVNVAPSPAAPSSPPVAASVALPRDIVVPAGASADRRQAAVLFADISGYTALCAHSDPEQVREMLGRFFDAMDRVVESYGGRVLDRAGDAVMAVFGAPIAHGNDAQRALRAAFAMHVAAAGVVDCSGAPLRLHIGVARGEVVAAVISGGGKDKYSVTGETVNLAARLDA